ncbi:RNA recognition motif domain-containing protein [Argonema galeatum]|uniref:RNA recognition motif domain-containing protein n=1 Tax=Argonema galeatum TaxID=2942762 RepID=UPI002011B90D|nr:RNA-binding protein [Argonema galeatum]MCL1463070.1 RNA-binding protein [Argonema galeatum A003/A1]
MSIYVGNLSYEVTQEDISNVFAEYGTVKRVQLPTDRETGRVRGFAFVEMENEAEETAAIDALDGAEWMGRNLKVNKAKPREDRGGGGGGGRGGDSRGRFNSGGGGGGGGGRRY